VKQSELDTLYPILKKYKDAKNANRILTVPFTTLIEYMWLLRGSCMLMDTKYCVLYLAAAVSDFYIPPNEMVCCRLLRYWMKYYKPKCWMGHLFEPDPVKCIVWQASKTIYYIHK